MSDGNDRLRTCLNECFHFECHLEPNSSSFFSLKSLIGDVTHKRQLQTFSFSSSIGASSADFAQTQAAFVVSTLIRSKLMRQGNDQLQTSLNNRFHRGLRIEPNSFSCPSLSSLIADVTRKRPASIIFVFSTVLFSRMSHRTLQFQPFIGESVRRSCHTKTISYWCFAIDVSLLTSHKTKQLQLSLFNQRFHRGFSMTPSSFSFVSLSSFSADVTGNWPASDNFQLQIPLWIPHRTKHIQQFFAEFSHR